MESSSHVGKIVLTLEFASSLKSRGRRLMLFGRAGELVPRR